jgi:hypothetical protein
MGKIAVSGVLICSSIVMWAADYVAGGWDPGRTGWVRDERIFNKTNVRNMRLLWKVKLDSNTRQMHNLMVPTVIEKVATPAGTREIAVLSGVSDDFWAFDTATGAQLWRKHFDPPSPESIAGRNLSTLCPGGQLANPAVAPGNGPGKYTLYSVS